MPSVPHSSNPRVPHLRLWTTLWALGWGVVYVVLMTVLSKSLRINGYSETVSAAAPPAAAGAQCAK